MMVGRLNGTVGGRPWSLDADDDSLTLQTHDLRSLLRVRSLWRHVRAFGRVLPIVFHSRIRVRIGESPYLPLPHWALRHL